MNQKIQSLIDGGFISTNDVLEHAGYLENKMNEYYQEEYNDDDAHEDLYGQEEPEEDYDYPFDLSSNRSEDPEYIIASTSYDFLETYIFDSNEKGEILNYGEYGGLCKRHNDPDWNNRDKAVEAVFPGLYEPVQTYRDVTRTENVYHSLYKRKS